MAHAGTTSFGPLYSTVQTDTKSVTVSVDPTISTNATLSLTFQGDLGDPPDESLTVFIDGIQVGVLNAPSSVNECLVYSDTITIPQATLAPLIADGQITITFQSTLQVDANCAPQAPFASATPLAFAVQGKLTYTSPNAVGNNTTLSTIRTFLNNRANAIASSSPDTTRMHGRFTGTLFGSSSPSGPMPLGGPADPGREIADVRRPVGGRDQTGERRLASVSVDNAEPASRPSGIAVSGDAEDGAGTMSFSASLSRMRQAAEAERAAKQAAPEGAMALGRGLGSALPPSTLPSAIDVWAEGRTTYYRDDLPDGRRRGHTNILYLGTDYLVRPSILLGVLVQFDWADETASALGTSASGRGWMAGPYISTQLTQHFFFDARAAWGRSDNDVSPFGTYSDEFSTERSLVSAKLTGVWWHGAFKLRPSAEMVYFREDQKEFTDSIGIFIPGQSVTLGRFTFGPEVGYQLVVSDGAVLEPFIGLKGVWDFDRSDDMTLAGIVTGHDPFRGRAEFGATLRTSSGFSFRGAASYDGIGDDDFHAWQGQLSIVVPLR